MTKHRIFTPQFWVLCSSTVFFMCSFSMLLPELPGYLKTLGGEEYIGWIVGLFTLNAFFSRFVSGRMADDAGRMKVIYIGTAVTVVASFAYLGVWSVWAFLALRFFHGLSTGFRPTGTTAYLSDVIHISRRGEAMGLLGVAGNAGMALGPAIGSVVRVHYGYDAMFIASGLLGVVALILTTRLKESLPDPKPIQLRHFNLFKGQLFDFSSWPAAVVLLPPAFAFGVFLTVSPDFVGDLGYTYRGAFNTTIVISSIATRFFAGKASDKHGRIPLLIIGAVLLAIGMGVISIAKDPLVASIGGVIYGVSIGINMPTIFAWTVDFAKPGKTAMALGTMLMSLEVGIGAGAFISGAMYQGDVSIIPMTYQLSALLSVLGVVVLLFMKPRFHKPFVSE
ncbi:MFS transporter [Sanyastnella coralliicola]|uniref:MFS transporter n=1 Tax=Sanyastnella coralliicola TaxID=3069118 RepID=UPI0027B93BA0|nr:MFS transporter [Longitalea sp. SCSIO 12813]